MKTIKEILEKLKLDLETDIPDILYSNDLDNFSVYHIGGSKNPKELGLFIYQDRTTLDAVNNTLSLIIQLQLYQKTEIESAEYQDILTGYMRDYDPDNLGMTMLNSIETDCWPIEQTGTTFIYLILNYIENLDSCD